MSSARPRIALEKLPLTTRWRPSSYGKLPWGVNYRELAPSGIKTFPFISWRTPLCFRVSPTSSSPLPLRLMFLSDVLNHCAHEEQSAHFLLFRFFFLFFSSGNPWHGRKCFILPELNLQTIHIPHLFIVIHRQEVVFRSGLVFVLDV